jgi:hypothetical protein
MPSSSLIALVAPAHVHAGSINKEVAGFHEAVRLVPY